MKNLNYQKGKARIIAVILLAVILIGGSYYFKQQAKPASTVIDKTTSWNNRSKNFFYADSSIEKEASQCSSDNPTTLGMNDCYGTAMKKYDAILDRVYELTLQDFDKAKVDDVKRFFTQYRAALCAIAYDEAQGGSIRGILYGGCYLEATRAQIQTLCLLDSSPNPSKCEGKIQL